MKPLRNARSTRTGETSNDKVVTSIFEFSNSLPTRLSSLSSLSIKARASNGKHLKQTDADQIADLASELRSHINTLHVFANDHGSGNQITVRKEDNWDKKGTELWNLCARLHRDEDPNDGGGTISQGVQKDSSMSFTWLLALARLLAFLFIDCGFKASQRDRRRTESGTASNLQNGGIGEFSKSVRLLKVATKAARSLLQQRHTELASKVLERAAEYEDTLAKGFDFRDVAQQDTRASAEQEEDQRLYARLRVEYFALRMMLAWKQSRLDMAEVMFSQLAPSLAHVSDDDSDALDPSAIESLADLMYEIGKDVFLKKDFESAVKWLERAHDALGTRDLERMSLDATELRCSVLHYLVRALLGLQTDDGRTKAADIVALLDNDYGGKLVVLLLKLEVLSAMEVFDVEQYYNVLHRMVRTVHLTEANFKTIMHHVHKLREHNLEATCRALDDLLTLRLHSAENQSWIEKAFITRIWATTQSNPEKNLLESMEGFVSDFATKLVKPLTASATHAAHTLLWKKVEENYKARNFEPTEAWCRLCLHKVFENAGDINKAKIMRRLICCFFYRQSPAAARQVFNEMSEAARDIPLTRYLMYKVALQDDDPEFAAECLDLISSQSSKDVTLLYACVLQAQHSGNRYQAIAALQRVLSSYGYNAPQGVHLPALIRVTARLLMSELAEADSPVIVASICNLFDGAATQVTQRQKQVKNATVTTDPFTDIELDWFIRNTYNTVLKFYGGWSSENVMLLLDACLAFMNCQITKVTSEKSNELRYRSAICHALAAHSCVQRARAEEYIARQLQHYLRVRKHAREFRKITATDAVSTDSPQSANLQQIAERILRNDFEAAIHLKLWDDLEGIIDDSRRPRSSETFEILTDMLLASQAPATVMLHMLDRIVSTNASSPVPTLVLARYLRIFYTLSIASSDADKTDIITSRTVELASSSPAADQYPAEELEWMATTTFNRAVDAYCTADEAQCRKLAQQAVEVAACLARVDRGALRDDLVRRAGLLVWEN